MQWIVKVGTDRKTAKGRYAEHAGFNHYGPFDGPTASKHAADIEAEFARAREEQGDEAFVYGEPVVEVIPLWSEDEAPGHTRLPFVWRAVANWYLGVEDQEPEMLGR